MPSGGWVYKTVQTPRVFLSRVNRDSVLNHFGIYIVRVQLERAYAIRTRSLHSKVQGIPCFYLKTFTCVTEIKGRMDTSGRKFDFIIQKLINFYYQ